MMTTETLRLLWRQAEGVVRSTHARTSESHHQTRLLASTSTVPFYVLHVCESILYMSQHYFQVEGYEYPPLTTIGTQDHGQAQDLSIVEKRLDESFAVINAYLDKASGEHLMETIQTFLGPMTRVEAFGLMLYHTYYHEGQSGLTLARGISRPVPTVTPRHVTA